MEKARGSQFSSFNGYIKQVPRAMFYLITGAYVVNIEKEDDVSVINRNGEVELAEQLKCKTRNIFDNCSKDFWNTLYNWVLNWKDENAKFTSSTRFVIYSSTNFDFKEVVKKLYEANEPTEIEEAWAAAKIIFAETKPKDFDYLDENKNITFKVIKQLEIVFPEESIDKDLDKIIETEYKDVYKDKFDNFVTHLNDWFYGKVIKLDPKKNKSCTISKKDFDVFITHYNGSKKAVKLPSYSELIPKDLEQLKNNQFYKQLEIVNAPLNIKDTAKKEYLSWKIIEGTELKEGLSSEKNLQQAYLEAKNNWEQKKSDIEDLHDDKSEDKRGRLLYSECQDVSIKIDGVEINDNGKRVARGVYNHLADKGLSHELSVGWHPQYKVMLEANGDFEQE